MSLGLQAAAPVVAPPLSDRNHWLVVHSGPDAETVDLTRYAAELRAEEGRVVEIVVVSPMRPSWLPDRSQWRDVYPAAPHFAHAERLVTAAGWGAIRDGAPFRDKHRYIPYPRALDDQFARAAVARGANDETRRITLMRSWAGA